MKIGILAVQGAFIEHEMALQKLGIPFVEIRQRKDLDSIDGIILPGGESTVQGKLLKNLDLFEPLLGMIHNGLPVLATCAGLILLAKELADDTTTHLATLPVTVKRNAYGRQLGSFETVGSVGDAIPNYPMIFIRAPYITQVGDNVEILSVIDSKIVGVKYNNQIGLAFHPEMTEDLRVHEEFLTLITQEKAL